MVYNMDFLIAAMVILLLILWDFLGQKRADDLNNQIFLFFAVLGILYVAAELLSNYYISSGGGDFGLAAMLTTTVFYLFQALLPFTLICYIVTLHDNKMISAKKNAAACFAHIFSDRSCIAQPVYGKAVLF